MVKLKFVIKDDTLVLRISEGKERFYRSAMSVLVGTPNLQRHWNADKEKFYPAAVSAKENNVALQKFKEVYSKLVLEHPDFSARTRHISGCYSKKKRETPATATMAPITARADIFSPNMKCEGMMRRMGVRAWRVLAIPVEV